MRIPTKYNKPCSRYSGLNPGLVEYGERVLTNSTSIRQRDYILHSYKTVRKSLSLCLLPAFCCDFYRYSETCLKRNLGITEICLQQETFTVPRTCCPRFQISSRCIKRNLGITEICLQQETFTVPRTCCPRFQISSRCIKRNSHCNRKKFRSLDIPFKTFHCIKNCNF